MEPMTDAEAMDFLAHWFRDNTDESGQWHNTMDCVNLAAKLVVNTGRNIIAPADSITRCKCGEIATYKGYCDRCISTVGRQYIDVYL